MNGRTSLRASYQKDWIAPSPTPLGILAGNPYIALLLPQTVSGLGQRLAFGGKQAPAKRPVANKVDGSHWRAADHNLPPFSIQPKIKDLRAKRDELGADGDKKQKDVLRRRISRLKKKTRALAG